MTDILCCGEACQDEAQYVCLCSCYETFWCESHLREHIDEPNRNHVVESIFSELTEWTKDGIIKFLSKAKLKEETLKKITFYKNICDPSNNEKPSEPTSDWEENSKIIKSISQVSAKLKDLSLNSLILTSDSDMENEDNNFIWFSILKQLRNQKLAILNKAKNDIETEKDFRKNCLFYEKNISNWLLSQSYKEYIKVYQKLTCICNIMVDKEEIILYIYDTESEEEKINTLKFPHESEADPKFIIQLPNCEWLVYFHDNNEEAIDYALIIDKNYRIRYLPPGGPHFSFTAIYFNRSIYCIGYSNYTDRKEGYDYSDYDFSKFNLDENRWIDLTPIDYFKSDWQHVWNSIIFKGNILISDYYNRNLLLYLIDIDSFSIIPYQFSKRSAKLLINVEERLYLIENDGWIYESEFENEYDWKQIGISAIYNSDWAAYCLYNKGGIYISTLEGNFRTYFKFDLSKKEIIEIDCYSNKLLVKRLGCKLKAIKCYGQIFDLDFDYIASECSPYRIAKDFEHIMKINKKLNKNPKDGRKYIKKGDILNGLGLNLEAIKYYDIAIQLKSKNGDAYNKKAEALKSLGRNNEALQCCNQAIKLEPNNTSFYFRKANVLRDSNMEFEAIETYNKIIKLDAFHKHAYFKKGVVLHDLGENIEALECYNKAIKLEPHNFEYFSYRANLYNDLGQEEEAIEDFNSAYQLMCENCDTTDYLYILIEVDNYLELLKILSNLLESVVKVKEELNKIKDANLKTLEIIEEAERKESLVKEQRSKLIKRAVESVNRQKLSIKEIKEIKKEISENKQATVDIIVQLCLSLYLQE